MAPVFGHEGLQAQLWAFAYLRLVGPQSLLQQTGSPFCECSPSRYRPAGPRTRPARQRRHPPANGTPPPAVCPTPGPATAATPPAAPCLHSGLVPQYARAATYAAHAVPPTRAASGPHPTVRQWRSQQSQLPEPVRALVQRPPAALHANRQHPQPPRRTVGPLDHRPQGA